MRIAFYFNECYINEIYIRRKYNMLNMLFLCAKNWPIPTLNGMLDLFFANRTISICDQCENVWFWFEEKKEDEENHFSQWTLPQWACEMILSMCIVMLYGICILEWCLKLEAF